jgi:hypothetical protein
MKEWVLKRFFEGQAFAQELAADLAGSMVRRSHDVIEHRIAVMDEHFNLRVEHLVRLCDAVLEGVVEPEHLETIGFCLVTSQRFALPSETSDSDYLAEVLHDWAAPEINYPLTRANVGQWRRRLKGEPTEFEHHHPRQQRKNRHSRS